jgi:hypothetical protein
MQINDRRGLAARLIGIEDRYQVYRRAPEQDASPDLRVSLGAFTPDLAGCFRVDHDHYMKEDYLYVQELRSKLGGRMRFAVQGLEGGALRLQIDPNVTASPFVAGRLLDFFISYLLTRKGYALIHASGICREGRAMLFSARGGGGKTTIALHGVQHKGYQFMGDNFTILGPGAAWGLLSDINFFGYNINRDVWKTLTRLERLKYRAAMSLYALTRGYIKIFLPINPLRFLGEAVRGTGRAERFFSILTQEHFIPPREVPRETVIRRTVVNHQLEFPLMSRIIDQVRCVYPSSCLGRYWTDYEAVLRVALGQGMDFQEIVFPRRIETGMLDEVFSSL